MQNRQELATGYVERDCSMITIYDLARITGYSAPTVSKALNGTGKLSDETRKTILAAAEKAKYKANVTARALTTKHTKLIGVILENTVMMRGFEHPLFCGILDTFREEMDEVGYDLLFMSKENKNGMSYIDHCAYRNVEGVLVVNPEENDLEMTKLAHSGIPCVSTNVIIPGVCTIVTDSAAAGQVAVEKLLAAGHTHIAFIGPSADKNNPASKERYEGYCEALAKANIPYSEDLVEYCPDWLSKSGYEAARNLFKRTNSVTAIFVASDLLAFGVMAYCHEVGKRIPEKISIIGFDDDRAAQFTSPPLSTFKQDTARIAQVAAEFLLQRINGVPVPDFVHVPAEYISRGSVAQLKK